MRLTPEREKEIREGVHPQTYGNMDRLLEEIDALREELILALDKVYRAEDHTWRIKKDKDDMQLRLKIIEEENHKLREELKQLKDRTQSWIL